MFLIKKACLRYDALSSTDSSKSIEKILSDILQYFFTKKKITKFLKGTQDIRTEFVLTLIDAQHMACCKHGSSKSKRREFCCFELFIAKVADF